MAAIRSFFSDPRPDRLQHKSRDDVVAKAAETSAAIDHMMASAQRLSLERPAESLDVAIQQLQQTRH